MTTNTDFSSQCNILDAIWIEHMNHEFFERFIKIDEDYIKINGLGLPLAHLIKNGIVESTPMAQEIIQQTFDNLLQEFEYEDEGFEALTDFWGFT